MMKECFKQDFVDAAKFKECASCPIFEECTQSVYLKDAKGAAIAGELLGYGLGLAGLVVGALKMPEMPAGSPWLILISLAYLLAVYRAGRGYGIRNRELAEHALHSAEAR
jgi:hypothetical protein